MVDNTDNFPSEQNTESEILRISYSNGPCFGTCPVYIVTFLPSGQLIYAGKKYVDKIGHYTARFGEMNWQHLKRLVEELRVDTWVSRTDVDDFPSTSFYVAKKDDRKWVTFQVFNWPQEPWILDRVLASLIPAPQYLEPLSSGLKGHVPASLRQFFRVGTIDTIRDQKPISELEVDHYLTFYPQINDDGYFELPLRSGRYVMRDLEHEFVVKPNKWTEALLSHDNGDVSTHIISSP